MPKPCKKTVEISPLAGPMNTRALPKEVPFGAWRWRQNLWVDPSRNVCRRPGWTKLLSYLSATRLNLDYNNEDLHDQGQASPDPREIISFLWEAVATSGTRRVLAGTDNQLFVSDFSQGTWSKIYQRSTEVETPTNWQTAQVSDGVVLSNGVDPLFVWPFDTPATIPIASLTAIGLSSARVLYSWKGVVFLGDVVMDGEHIPHRVLWGDLNDPLDFSPSNASIGGFQDLSYGERILRFRELGDFLLIYTDKSIWQVTAVGGAAVFNFRAAYQALETGEACLAYPNTLASTGESHLFLGNDGIYEFDLFKPKPDRVEWMHACSNIIFDTIDAEVCYQHNATYHPPTKEYLVSWVESTATVALRPQRALAFNREAKTSDVIDHGFTAMLTHIPDLRVSVVEAVSTEYEAIIADPNNVAGGCLCGEEEFNAIMAEQFAALFPTLPTPPAPAGECNSTDWTCEPQFLSGFTGDLITFDGRVVENPEGQPNGALCRFLNAHVNLQDCLECATRARLILVSATDNTLKEFGTVYYRERYTGALTDPRGCGAYTNDNYQVIGILGPMNFELPDEMKTLSRLEFEYYAALAGTDLKLVPSIATSDYAAEPLGPDTGLVLSQCRMVYRPLSLRTLTCQSAGKVITSQGNKPPATVGAVGAQNLEWTVFFSGRYLTLKFVVDGQVTTNAGGAVCFPVLRMEVFSNTKWPQAKD